MVFGAANIFPPSLHVSVTLPIYYVKILYIFILYFHSGFIIFLFSSEDVSNLG